MAIKKIRPFVSSLNKEINYALKLARKGCAIQQAYQPQRGPRLLLEEVDLIFELAFHKVFIAYEVFLENIFVGYMLGAESPQKYKPHRYVSPQDEAHARKMILQDYSGYADWSTPSKLINRAEYCFKNGEPFKSGMSAMYSVAQDIKTIRNAISHKSIKTHDKFKEVVRRYLVTLPAGQKITVGWFLRLQNNSTTVPQDYLDMFCQEILNFSSRIAP